jgi:Kdo2-lipid IVA lauroyltransferase/acyltransferase
MVRLFRFFSRWPLGLLHALGFVLGWAAFLSSASYRKRLWQHARAAGLTPAQRLASIGHAGRMVAETPYLWGRPRDASLGKRVQWRGAEHVDQAVAQGRGVMILTPHLGCFEVVAQAYAERHGAEHPITALYRPSKQPWLAEMMVHARNRPGILASPATLSGVRQLVRALKKGDTIGVLPDQVPPEGMGEWAPFFGRSAYTMTMAAKLIAQTGCTPVLLRGERLGLLQRWRQGCDFVVHATAVHAPAMAVLREGNNVRSAEVMNQLMEAMIRQCPEQYLWGYNRYKGPRPDILTTAAEP